MKEEKRERERDRKDDGGARTISGNERAMLSLFWGREKVEEEEKGLTSCEPLFSRLVGRNGEL